MHGNVFNWDYYRDASTTTARTTTSAWRRSPRWSTRSAPSAAARPRCCSTPATRSRARRWRPTTPSRSRSPRPARRTRWPRAMNVIGYDAVTLGNHEFNYGLPLLRPVDPPARLPGAGRERGRRAHRPPAFPPYVIKKVSLGRRRADAPGRHPRPDQPGHRHLGQGQRRGQAALPRLVTTAAKWVPIMRAPAPTSSSSPRTAATAAPPATARAAEREPVRADRRAGARHRRDPLRPRAHRGRRSASSPTRRPASRCCCPSRRGGASG